jgi:glycosyltransferase involved in cell wall biosynthesis
VRKPRVLYVLPNHPTVRPGGLELYALDLYKALRAGDDFDAVLVARTGAPFTTTPPQHPDSAFTMVDDDPNQYLFTNGIAPDLSNYDALFGITPDKEASTRRFADFLRAVQPDIVHFQHTLFLGYDLIRVTRNTLPNVPILLMLPEYIPICHRDGQMVRTMNDELCQKESPRRCHECFPEIAPQTFYMRKRFIQSHLDLVDCFIAPLDYVKHRYAEWGVPANRIVVEPFGFTPVSRLEAEDPAEHRARNRFAFFGQVSPYKGADVLLRAMDILGEDFDGELRIFGGNLEIQDPRWQERFAKLLRERANVSFPGAYDRDEDLGKLMAKIDWVVVPSIWWETGPLVVWEAFQHGRPVICSDIGGMSEKVTDGVDGLHFRSGDAEDLAEKMTQAVETPGLWDQLRAGIPVPAGHSMSTHVATLSDIYGRLLAERGVANATAPAGIAHG